MPAESSTCAADARSSSIAALFWMPERNEAVRAEMSTAPARAVPIEAPRLVTVFCRPPTSPLCSSGTDETVTAPSCDASAPTPRPASSIGQVTISGPAPASSAATITTMPANSATKPSCTTRRGEACGNTLGMPAAASSSVIDSGSSRTPVAIADSPRATDRNSGTAKKSPACRRYWKKNDGEPAAQRSRFSQDRRVDRAPPGPRANRRFSQPRNSHEHDPAAEDQPDDRRQPEPLGRFGLGLHEPPGAGAQDAVDDEAQPERGQRGADEVEPRSLLGRGVGHAPGEDQDDDDDEHLTGEHPAATTGRS